MKVGKDIRFSTVPAWLIYANVSAYAVRVWAVLDREADSTTGECEVSIATIARKARCSPTTVKKSLRELEGVGALEARRGRIDTAGDPDVNAYTLLISEPGGGSSRALPQSPGDQGVGHLATEGVGHEAPPKRKPLNKKAPTGGSGQTPPAPDPFSAPTQKLVGHYVETAQSFGADPTPKLKARIGNEIKTLLRAGKSVRLVQAAVEVVAEANKSPGSLELVLLDIEQEIHKQKRRAG